ncbi:MAG: hypothetical protein ACTSQY_00780 [Candidatus Odinarchaeia archaeon]
MKNTNWTEEEFEQFKNGDLTCQADRRGLEDRKEKNEICEGCIYIHDCEKFYK